MVSRRPQTQAQKNDDFTAIIVVIGEPITSTIPASASPPLPTWNLLELALSPLLLRNDNGDNQYGYRSPVRLYSMEWKDGAMLCAAS